MTEKELKEASFGIVSLGRRKKLIRAINFLKASLCRATKNHSAENLQVARPKTLLRAPTLKRLN